jgi:signal transduction histidine kinase
MTVWSTVEAVPSVQLAGEPPRHPIIRSLSERQWLVLDGAAALAGFLLAALELHAPGTTEELAGIGPVLVASAPVAVRRRWPLPVLAVVATAIAALTTAGLSVLPLDAMLGCAAYTVAVQVPRRSSLYALAGSEAIMALALGVVLVRTHTPGNAGIENLLVLAAAWFIGDGMSARRACTAWRAQRQQTMEAEAARQTVRDERVRIARELHDVVAHSLTVITVQADLARRLMAKRQNRAGPVPGPALEASALEASALEKIEAIGRAAQEELRVVLGLLRDDDAERAERAPAPGLAALPELASTIRAAGIPVELRVRAAGRLLSPALELSVYRIIQEALTNVVKHAPGARATVELAISAREIRIDVIDDGQAGPARSRPAARPLPDRAASAGARHGIVGMRERVGAFGGWLTAEGLPGRGFQVTALIPLPGTR